MDLEACDPVDWKETEGARPQLATVAEKRFPYRRPLLYSGNVYVAKGGDGE